MTANPAPGQISIRPSSTLRAAKSLVGIWTVSRKTSKIVATQSGITLAATAWTTRRVVKPTTRLIGQACRARQSFHNRGGIGPLGAEAVVKGDAAEFLQRSGADAGALRR